MLGRHRRKAGQADQEPVADGAATAEQAGDGGAAGRGTGSGSPDGGGPGSGTTGPWDLDADQVPAADRIDLGSLQVPSLEGLEVQVGVAEEQAAWVTVVSGQSSLQLQAFAAPRNDGLWDAVCEEIEAEVAKAGGESERVAGRFGPELRARFAPPPPAPHAKAPQPEPVRFLGVDGPRWFLRGVISGPAASSDELARPLEDVFADVVVARGSHPVPPRDLLEIRLPEELRQALAAQLPEPPAQDEGERWGGIELPQRGPEITETR